jgi:aminomethyltransferase
VKTPPNKPEPPGRPPKPPSRSASKTPKRSAPEGTQAIQRALLLLEELASGPRDRGLGELASALELTKPTAHRILAALEAGGMVARSPEGSFYRLGAGAGELDRAALRQRGGSLARTTPLHRRHLEHVTGFSWREWSGYRCPLVYGHSYGREYWAVRDAAGVIDVSPLFKYEVRGRDARALLQRVLTRDLAKLRPGRVAYSAWCDDAGKALQDGNVVCLAEDRFRLTAAHPTQRWLEDCGFGLDAEIADVSEKVGALALQGPRARAILQEAADDGGAIAALGYFGAVETAIDGVVVEVTRTGFTGDLGYEIWMPAGDAERVWDALFRAGGRHGLLPVGLDALDVLRIEAGLVLIDVDYVAAHQSLLERRKSTPDEAGLGWTVKLTPGNEFVGRAAIERERQEGAGEAAGSSWALVGVEVPWFELERVYGALGLRPMTPGQSPVRKPAPLLQGERQVGQVTSQVFSPLLKKQIGIASVEARCAAPGTLLELEAVVDVRRVTFAARVAPLPFFDPERKRATAAAPVRKAATAETRS